MDFSCEIVWNCELSDFVWFHKVDYLCWVDWYNLRCSWNNVRQWHSHMGLQSPLPCPNPGQRQPRNFRSHNHGQPRHLHGTPPLQHHLRRPLLHLRSPRRYPIYLKLRHLQPSQLLCSPQLQRHSHPDPDRLQLKINSHLLICYSHYSLNRQCSFISYGFRLQFIWMSYVRPAEHDEFEFYSISFHSRTLI